MVSLAVGAVVMAGTPRGASSDRQDAGVMTLRCGAKEVPVRSRADGGVDHCQNDWCYVAGQLDDCPWASGRTEYHGCMCIPPG